MSPTTPSTWPRLAGLTLAGAGLTAAGLVEPGFRWFALAGCGAWAVAGWHGLGRAGAVPPVLPAMALLAGGWWALLPWMVAGACAGRLLSQEITAEQRARLRLAREALHDAERESQVLHRHIQRYPALLETCLELSGARNLDQLAAGLCARARDLVPRLESARVFLGTSSEPVCRASCDGDGNPCARPPGPDERYVASESRPLTLRAGKRLRVLLPLRGDRRRDGDGEALRGVLEVVFDAEGDRHALELLEALSRLGGLGLAAVDLLNQARGLALRDELTGLYGQHEFLRRLDENAASCRRHGQVLGVLMCDMDHLKAFNDRWGHPAGDVALREVAAALRAAMPSGAIACRYGGEEFAALLIGIDAAGLATTAETVRAAIAAAVADPTHAERRVTASLGWALLRSDETARGALARADAACYAAKRAGRNRVEAAP